MCGRTLEWLRGSALLRRPTVAVDSTTSESTTALRAIVQRGDGRKYDAPPERLASLAGIEKPPRQDEGRQDARAAPPRCRREHRDRCRGRHPVQTTGDGDTPLLPLTSEFTFEKEGVSPHALSH